MLQTAILLANHSIMNTSEQALKLLIDEEMARRELLHEKLKTCSERLATLKSMCTHNWEYDFTCGHKREDYYKCNICGKTR